MTPRVPDEQLDFARGLRSDMTVAEILMWRILRGRRVGAKFRRQVPIGPYVADFVCVAARLIVELDGSPHLEIQRRQRDGERDIWFRACGWTVVRILNSDVLPGGDLVVARIQRVIADFPHPTLADARATFSRRAGEGSTEKEHP